MKLNWIMFHKHLLPALITVTSAAVGVAAIAETPEDVKQRMELYRKREEAAEQRKAERAAEDAARREKTRLCQEERRAEEYTRTWKLYGHDEVNILSWRQHKDGSWLADAKLSSVMQQNSPFPLTKPPARFDASLDTLVRDGLVSPAERRRVLERSSIGLPPSSTDKIWVKVRQPISLEELSRSLRLDEERLARLNDVNEDYRFRQGDWLAVPSQQTHQIKQLAAIDTSELRRTPPLQSLPPIEDRAVVR